MSNVTLKLIEAYSKINEKKKLDPVDAKALKGKHDDREDGDIDNDGDEDESDEYLHNRRKAVKKAMDEGKEECPKCEGEGCDHCDGMGYHMTNEEVELDEASASVYKDVPRTPGKMVSNRVQVKAFKDTNAMGAFLSKQNDNSWKETGVSGLKSGKYKIDMVKQGGKPSKNFIKVNEEVELDEMTSAQKSKFDKLYKQMLNGPEHKKIMSKADNKIKGDDQFHALVKKMAMEEVSEAMTISRKMAQRALASAKAQPKDKVSLKKAPWDKDKKSTNEEEVIMNPKQKKDEKGSATMANEEVELPTIYSRILENRAKQTKGATAPEDWNEKEKNNKGAMDMKADHAVDSTGKISNYDDLGHDDASKAGRASPNAKARSGDNMKGDKKVIPSATKMKG